MLSSNLCCLMCVNAIVINIAKKVKLNIHKYV